MLTFLFLTALNCSWATSWEEPVSDVLFAGVSSNDVTPEIGVPLAGFGGGDRRIVPYDVQDRYPYAHFLTPSQGKRDPIRAKAVYLERGRQKWLWIGLDTVAVSDELRQDLIKMLSILDIRSEQIFITATHTHSGPGDLTRNAMWSVIASDMFHTTVYNRFLIDVWTTAIEAIGSTQRAQIRWSQTPVQGLQRNRADREGHFDSEARTLWITTASGKIRAAIVNFALHGTALSGGNLNFSADAPGAIETEMESAIQSQLPHARRPVVMFVNGAEGDVTPATPGEAALSSIGKSFAQQVIPSFQESKVIENPTWSITTKKVRLGSAHVNLSACAGDSFLGDLLKPFSLNIGALMPKEATIWAAQLGPIYMMTMPGEPTTDIGLQLKKMAKEKGFESTWVMGLTNQHLAYLLTPEEYAKPGYQSCASLYGSKGGSLLVSGHQSMLQSIKR